MARAHLAPHLESISVDGCTSTNDSVLLFASGAAGGPPVTPGGEEWDAWPKRSSEVGASLASQLIHDGEGVTHVMLVDLTGAADDRAARALAATVADSPLVKTALFGGDPNPGRILQALGTAGEGLCSGRRSMSGSGRRSWSTAARSRRRTSRPTRSVRRRSPRWPRPRCRSASPSATARDESRARVRSVLRLRPDQRGVHDLMTTDLPPQIRERTVAKARTLLEALPFMQRARRYACSC